MFLGDILISHGLVSPADVEAALKYQKVQGGRLGENLVALGKLKREDLVNVIQEAPPAPRTLADTGLGLTDLLNLLIKTMYSGNAETPTLIADSMKLPVRTIHLLIAQAEERKLLEILGSAGTLVMSELRYALSEKGKQWALDAIAQNQYVGPAPVSLAAYSERIDRQRITNELVDRAAIDAAFNKLIISQRFIQQIGPAINSGRSILMYGPPGNGKTSIAERIGRAFRDIVYIPYCFEVEGQIIKVFDPGVHKTAQSSVETKGIVVRREDIDRRWLPCRRPFIMVGGELTLEMLDLSFNTNAKYYEAPVHVKALGGIFLIDDFGRQLVTPEALLNRWIVPLESRIEYLKLHTGKNFALPFDELVIFSTNLAPNQLMDPAFLRRIPYKLQISAPSPDEYRQIFRIVSKSLGINANEEVIDFVIRELRERNDFPLASYQPRFIVDQIKAACKFEGVAPAYRRDLVIEALENLFTSDTPGYKVGFSEKPETRTER
jgi:SpoVK/Ycf46/Vps4 family AAA+-type ATPase